MFKIQPPLGYRLGWNDMASDVTLEDVGDTEFDIICMLPRQRI